MCVSAEGMCPFQSFRKVLQSEPGEIGTCCVPRAAGVWHADTIESKHVHPIFQQKGARLEQQCPLLFFTLNHQTWLHNLEFYDLSKTLCFPLFYLYVFL